MGQKWARAPAGAARPPGCRARRLGAGRGRAGLVLVLRVGGLRIQRSVRRRGRPSAPQQEKAPLRLGALPVLAGPPLFLLLLALSFGPASFLPTTFTTMLAMYFAGTLSYSLYLKRILTLDVLVLAGLDTHRILSGGIATGVKGARGCSASRCSSSPASRSPSATSSSPAHGRRSDQEPRRFRTDLDMVSSMGTASGYIAALVFMLYVESSAVRANYREPGLACWCFGAAVLARSISAARGSRPNARRPGEIRAERPAQHGVWRHHRDDCDLGALCSVLVFDAHSVEGDRTEKYPPLLRDERRHD